MRFLGQALALLLTPSHCLLRTSPHHTLPPPSDVFRHRQRLVDDIDELIRSSVHAFAAEISLLRSLVPSSPPTPPEREANATDGAVELIDHEFNRLSYHSDRSLDIYAYNSLLRAWFDSRRADAAEQCDEVFARLKYAELSPDEDTYDILVRVWSRERGERAARRAFEHFKAGRDLNMNFTAATCELLLRTLLAHLDRTEAFQCASEAAEYMQRLSVPLPDSVFAEYLELVLACSEHLPAT